MFNAKHNRLGNGGMLTLFHLFIGLSGSERWLPNYVRTISHRVNWYLLKMNGAIPCDLFTNMFNCASG